MLTLVLPRIVTEIDNAGRLAEPPPAIILKTNVFDQLFRSSHNELIEERIQPVAGLRDIQNNKIQAKTRSRDVPRKAEANKIANREQDLQAAEQFL